MSSQIKQPWNVVFPCHETDIPPLIKFVYSLILGIGLSPAVTGWRLFNMLLRTLLRHTSKTRSTSTLVSVCVECGCVCHSENNDQQIELLGC